MTNMNPYQNFIAVSRYARWLDDDNRRETWPETAARYVGFMRKHLSTKYGYDAKDPIFDEVQTAITNLDVVPSMRAIMTAGEALERNNLAGYNPVTGDTEVLTKEFGLIRIDKLVGTTATVLNVDGRWTEATFRSYGIQPLMRVTTHQAHTNTKREVRCTANHRWVLADGEVVPTENLKAGDRLPFASAPRPSTTDIDYRLGLVHGLIYGDGTTTYSQERTKGYHIRLCGDHDDLLPILAEQGSVCYPPSANGDPVVMLYGTFAKTHSLKTLPAIEETDSYLLGFIRGWMAADGSVGESGQATLCTTEEGLAWLDEVGPRVGILNTGASELAGKTNFGDRKRRTLAVRLNRASLVADDFIVARKRDRFKETDTRFLVDAVEVIDEHAEVFCAEVPDTNTFVLDGGLVTGNCSFVAVNDPRVFDEAMYVLMNGTGLGFSVERKYVEQLPVVPETLTPSDEVIVVGDSKEGWAKAYRSLVNELFNGRIMKWDVSEVRPAGARLKTFGGRASGPQPLVDLFNFTVDTFKDAAGRRLSPIECHDLMCKVGDIVVVGGVRRSALISLSDLDDFAMAKAKSGNWWENNPQRALANNSVTYYERPSSTQFLREWRNLIESQSGERGIFNLAGIRKHTEAMVPSRDAELIKGTNPCGEIALRDMGLCNLSEVIIAEGDSVDDVKNKVRLATIIGTWQSTLTDFPYMRAGWRANAEDERLLGVSLTGIYGHRKFNNPNDEGLPKRLAGLRKIAHETNKAEAEKVGVSASKAITTVKPSGTVSQLALVSSGIHPWHSEYYIRTVRAANTDPLTALMKDAGVPNEPDFMKPEKSTVFSFPTKAPEGAVTRHEVTALDHLRLYSIYRNFYTDHNVSITVSVKESEWVSVGAWVFDHWDEVGGVSFLPHSDHTYQQAPYQDCSREEYEAAMADFPADVRFADLHFYETEDGTSGNQTLACTAAGCEAVDLA